MNDVKPTRKRCRSEQNAIRDSQRIKKIIDDQLQGGNLVITIMRSDLNLDGTVDDGRGHGTFIPTSKLVRYMILNRFQL